MQSFMERQSSRLYHYLLRAIQRELRLTETEIRKYETTVALGGVGLVCLLIGKFSGLIYLQLIGALSLAAGLLKAVDEPTPEKETPK